MIHIEIIDAHLKTSFEELKDELQKLMGHELSQLKCDCYNNLTGYIRVSSHGRYNEIDVLGVLGVLAKHCNYFEVEAGQCRYSKDWPPYY